MNTLTVPISFGSAAAMNSWYENFDAEAREICQKYNDADLWENRAVVLKDPKEKVIAIVSLGAYRSGSNTHKAVDEILKAFNSSFE